MPLQRIEECPLCPYAALAELFKATDPLLRRQLNKTDIGNEFAFQEPMGKKNTLKPMTHSYLVAGFKLLAKAAGYSPDEFAGHSLRRGGASAAFDMEAPPLLVKA